jgi:hypothetical protein
MRAVLILPLLLAASCFSARAQSNIDPQHDQAGTEFIGTIDWRPGEFGAVINPFFCSGFIYGENVGWIQLGGGEPANKWHYSNLSAADYGVNVESSGALRGFAYGANIGWINFESTGNPMVNWVTGQLSGRAYSANAGWINLSDANGFVRVANLPAAPDSDLDGLPDAWEIANAGNLTSLGRDQDSDGDGITDFAEYIAGTGPLDPNDFLAVALDVAVDSSLSIQWQSKPSVVYRIESRSAFDSTSTWVDAGYPPLTGTGGPLSVALGPGVDQSNFYRVVAYPPLTQL